MLTHEYLKSVLHYDPESGVFTRLISNNGFIKINSIAGTIHPKGYVIIGINKKYYKAHRLAWFYMHGVWPENQIDHINHNKSDNSIINLRLATNAENTQNKIKPRSDNKCGLLGVSYYKNYGNYVAQIQVNNKKRLLGYFTTPEEAHEAYLKAKRELHPFCTI